MGESSCTAGHAAAKDEIAANVRRFEKLIAEHSDRLRRIELLLDEIAADDKPADNRG